MTGAATFVCDEALLRRGSGCRRAEERRSAFFYCFITTTCSACRDAASRAGSRVVVDAVAVAGRIDVGQLALALGNPFMYASIIPLRCRSISDDAPQVGEWGCLWLLISGFSRDAR
jgi:hypothetical protein